MPGAFEKLYPRITLWVKTHGWLEIGQMGQDDYSRAFVRALDGGGMVWEGKEQEQYATIDQALQALEVGLAKWMGEH